MTTQALQTTTLQDRVRQILAAPLWMWCLFTMLCYLALVVMPDPPPLRQMLGDTDDATRLTAVREFLAGASWFDTTLPRFGAPEHLLSHWSRLIDLPLAILIRFCELFVPTADAEVAVRAVWPLMLFAPLLFVIARAAETRGGRVAALVAFALTILCFAGIVQFRPGRIDHHNAQNLAAVAGIFLLSSSFSNARHGTLAGIVLGLGMAIGYEAMLIIGSGLAIAALLALWTGKGHDGVERAAVAFAATLAAAFVLTTAPSRWFDVHCDALSLNMVLLAAVAAAGLVAVFRHATALTQKMQLGALAGAGGLAIVTYALTEPACLAGPFGQVDPGVFPIWLSYVSETQNIFWLYHHIPPTAVAIVLHIAVALIATAIILRNERDNGALFYAAAFLVTAVLSFWQVKLMQYAALMAIPPLAIVISRIRALPDVSAPTLRFGATVLLNQTCLLLAGAMIAGMSSPEMEEFKKKVAGDQACISTENIRPLAALPKGLVVAEIDLGPYLVALTSLDTVAAPYHRLDTSIIEAQAILDARPAEAERRLRALGASYVVTCARPVVRPGEAELPPDALTPSLLAGRAPQFLEAVPLAGSTPFKVWRLRSP